MKDQTMAKFPGLSLRDGVYQLRVMIPLDLQAAYGGRTSFRESLATSSPREANLRAALRRSQLLQVLEEKRREVFPQRLSEVPLELAQELAQRVGARVLRGDDDMRDSDAGRAALAELATRLQAPMDALKLTGTLPPSSPDTQPMRYMAEGLTHSEAGVLAGLNDLRETEAAVAMALRQRTSVLPLLMHEAMKLGLSFSADAPGVKEAMGLALVEYRKATEGAALRDSGAIVETPVVQEGRKVAVKPLKLRDIFTRWKASKVRSADSVAACERALVLYEEFTKDPDLLKLTRSEGDGFRAFLLTRGGASKTASDRMTWVKSLLKYAHQELEAIPKHPWAGLDIESSTTTRRKPWSDSELRKLFAAPLFTAYELPTAWRAGKDAAYWIPLLALYTGARVGELAQLRAEDIDAVSEVPMLSITDEGEGQQVKTAAGVRSVPIHSELIRLGFLDYLATLPPDGPLWPALKLRAGKPGGYFSDWFGTYRNGLELAHDFHSFRHTVRSALVEAGLAEPLIDRICGHESRGSTGARVYTHVSPKSLSKAIEVLKFPELSRAYAVAPPMK